MGSLPLRIYWAGDLFDSKDIGGNLMLAQAVEAESGGRYKVMLPQDGECEVGVRTSQSIRDADFQLLFACDVIVANFDGHDLDSGTVVEFCFAKMVDMPAVLLRTDFRNSGDHSLPDGDPWNLMCSHYPRTVVRHLNAMAIYHDCRKEVEPAAELLAAYYAGIAGEVVAALDEAAGQQGWLTAEELAGQYRRAVRSIGGTLPEILDDRMLDEIVSRRLAR
ncbi:MAG: nucleoside 2-deoxyribosyltransferase [Lentisphaeria bacterium]|nr:nucleoside 2-deoxyribosyltransferase [Lentisphaeria bacterium]